MSFHISLTVGVEQLPAKTLMFIKKETGMAPTEIREKVANHHPLFEWDALNYHSSIVANLLFHTLDSQGCQPKIFMNEKPHFLEEEFVGYKNFREVPMGTLSITAAQAKVPAKTLLTLKKLLDDSPSNIQRNIQEEKPLMLWDDSNFNACDRAINIYKLLEADDLEPQLLVDGKNESIEYFQNLMNTIIEYAEKDGLTKEELLDEPLR